MPTYRIILWNYRGRRVNQIKCCVCKKLYTSKYQKAFCPHGNQDVMLISEIEKAIDSLDNMWHHFMDPEEVQEYLREELGL